MAVASRPGTIRPPVRPVISPRVNETLTDATNRGGGGGGGTTTTPPPAPPAAPVIPTRADPTGQPIGVATPYDQDQTLAEQAWQNVQDSINLKKGATYVNYGVDPTGRELDPALLPFGQEQQQQRASADAEAAIRAAMHSRGLHGGLAGQAASDAQLAAGGADLVIRNALQGEEDTLDTALTQGQADYNTAIGTAKQNAINWAISNNIFTPYSPGRSDTDVKALVNKAAADWVKKYGGIDKTNKAGQTFQDRLNMYGQNLYDPSKTFRFGGKNYGVAAGG